MTDKAISPLRRRLIEDMEIRRLSPKTQYQYIRHVKKFADFLGRSADKTSWIVTTLTGAAIRCSALVFNRARRSSSSRPLPPTSVCLDIFLLPGASDVTTHVERLSSNETNKVARSPGMPVCSGMGRVVARCIGRSLDSVVGDVDLPELSPHLHRICMR